jgi:hypothetical protein
MTLKELKKENQPAYATLIDMWSELSRCSTIAARRYLNVDMGDRFSIEKNDKDDLIFHDSHAGDTWKYSEKLNDWTWLLNS